VFNKDKESLKKKNFKNLGNKNFLKSKKKSQLKATPAGKTKF
jgi:hypothetical protein